MQIIGLTGGIGSGKSTAARYFSELGIDVIDADVIAHALTTKNTPTLKKISEHFGSNILDPQGELRRDALRTIIFSNADERLWLENLLHPLILEEMFSRAKKATSAYCVLVIPLLLEKNIKTDRVLVIDCPTNIQIDRIRARDSLNMNQIDAMLQTQLSREQRLAQADDIIHNESTLAELHTQVQKMHTKYLQLAP